MSGKYNELADRLPDHSAAAALTRPDGLMADRFYGTPDLIAFAIAKCWVDRLRIKSNLKVFEGGHKTALGEHVSDRLPYLASIALTQRRIITNIGIINEPAVSTGILEAATNPTVDEKSPKR